MNLDIVEQGKLYLKFFDYQIPDIYQFQNLRLTHSDILRIFRNIDTDIFSKDTCTYYKSHRRSTCFFKKELLHKLPFRRILYINYKDIDIDGYLIKNTCNNRGCLNVCHLYKLKKKLRKL